MEERGRGGGEDKEEITSERSGHENQTKKLQRHKEKERN